MNQFSNNSVAQGSEMDLGLRSFMLGTYKYMIAAMIVSGLSAYGFAQLIVDANGYSTALGQMLRSPIAFLALVIGIPVAFGVVGAKLHSMSLPATRVFLFGFAAVMGIWLSAIAAYADPKVAMRIFFMASAMFAGISLFGYTTKVNLGPIGVFCGMVFLGVVVMMLFGAFKPSMIGNTMFMILNGVGLVAIAGITAWETQGLKRIYYGTVGNPEMAEKYAVVGAASLLLSFINIFILLMNLFGND